jgi:uncharacterized protein (TIGR02271 family)
VPEVTQQSHAWVGSEAFDASGEKVGKVGDVYLDRLSHLPAWVVVHAGLLGTRKVFVPVTGATIDDEGVKLAFSGDQIAGAPRPDADGALTPREEQALFHHYGVDTDSHQSTGGIPQPSPPEPVRRLASDDQLPAEMIRSEEELHVTTVWRPSEVLRLRKVVVTEEVTVTVSLRREEIRVEHVPVTAGVSDAELADLLTEAAQVNVSELVLLEEQPVVEKRLVPYERVRFSKAVVTEERQVTDQVRKEQITTDYEPAAKR